jgi:hypothetical protein
MTDAHGRHYRIAREPGGPVEIVHLEQLEGGAAWSVMAVSDEPMPCDDLDPTACFALSMSMGEQEAQLSFAMLGAESVDVELSHGTPARGSTIDGQVTLPLDRDPGAPGYLLLLYRDAEGRVFRAFGYTLPPGDVSAP